MMGAWGTGLTSNDTASDVLDACREIYPVVSPEEADRMILEEFKDVLANDEDDLDYTNFWYVYTDWQWKHGVLPDKNKEIALHLLEKPCGMAEWEEAGNASDIRARLKVLAGLKERLSSPQPPQKVAKLRLKKPKHKVGDILVFRTPVYENPDDRVYWRIPTSDSLYSKGRFFVDRNKLPRKLEQEFCAEGKYMAVLCVGTCTEPYSPRFPHLLNEHSTYAYYDYCDDKEPTPEDLKRCGFLPNVWYKLMPNRGVFDAPVEEIKWNYFFWLYCPFLPAWQSVVSFNKYHVESESKRFHHPLSRKNYSDVVSFNMDLPLEFVCRYKVKMLFSSVHVPIDNLLDENVQNPLLLSPDTFNQLEHKHI